VRVGVCESQYQMLVLLCLNIDIITCKAVCVRAVVCERCDV
jgi:hypothetical protein